MGTEWRKPDAGEHSETWEDELFLSAQWKTFREPEPRWDLD